MKLSWGRRLVRICLVIIAVLVAIGVGLFIWNPEATTLLALVILQPLVANTQPPPIADGHIKSNDELTGVLRQNFPAGTDEAALKAALLRQGFKPPTPPPEQCWPQGKPAPVGQVIFPCPTHDPARTLEYQWSNFPCGDTIRVWWTIGDNGAVAQIDGYHSHACL